MRIAVIGSGISGLACAHYLSPAHEVSVFEARRRVGGHTATVDVQLGTRRYALDTGFIVFNDRTYPNFIALMRQLGVPSKPTTMGFSVRDPASDWSMPAPISIRCSPSAKTCSRSPSSP